MIDPYLEENIASTRAHLLWIYGRLDQLHSLGLNSIHRNSISEEGRREFKGLIENGFTPNRDRVIELLLVIVGVNPSLVYHVTELMTQYDWIVEELEKDCKEFQL